MKESTRMHSKTKFHSYTIFSAPMTTALIGLALPAAAADKGIEAAGKNQYLNYCAVCHGEDAKGGGPFANVLNKAPPDLTVLTKANDGTFPFDKIYSAIDGRKSVGGAHGSKDMPIWGSEWKDSTVLTETALRGRILEMIIYLRSIQQ